MVTIKSKKEIELMREACKVVALTHQAIEQSIKPGMTTAELDQIIEKTIKKYGAISAEKGYNPGIKGVPPFPAASCISINDEIIHGVPSNKRIIKDGDIITFREDTAYNKESSHSNIREGLNLLLIKVNGEEIALSGKDNYVFVDVFDFYPFDLSVMRGSKLITKINGEKVAFIEPLNDGDIIEIYWEK